MTSQKRIFYAVLFLVFGFYCCASQFVSAKEIFHVNAASKIPLKKYSEEDFFGNPPEKDHQISPNGQYLSFKGEWQGYRNLFIRKIGSQDAPIRVTSETDRDIGSYFWKGSDHLLYFKDKGGDENFHLYVTTPTRQHGQDLTPFPRVRVELVDKLSVHPEEILINHNLRDERYADVYRLNVKTGDLKLEVQNPGKIVSPNPLYQPVGWFADHKGRIRLATQMDGLEIKLLHRFTEEEPFQPLLTWQFPDEVRPLSFTSDNQKIYLATNIGRDKLAIVLFNLKTKKEEKVLYSHPDVDVYHLGFASHKLIPGFVEYVTGKTERVFFNARTKASYTYLEKKFPGYHVDIVDGDQAGKKQLIKISNDRTPGKIYLFEKQRKKLSLVADLNPRINEKDMAAMQYVHYWAQDGLRIPAYLTLPPHKLALNLPTIILPHGGPEWRDDGEYNAHVQYLAHKGYAVLQPNFRGSMSYGKAFRTAGFREWGGKMQDDLRDGVGWLVEKKIADPTRVVIYGGSYGGYAALMGIMKTPDLYAAAVDVVGVSSIPTFLKSIPAYWSHFHAPYRVEIGDVEKEPEFIQSISPLHQAKRVQVPVFVAQGGNDPRVVRKESDQMVDALQKQGVEVEYMLFPDEGHGFSKAAHVIAFYQKMSSFLEKHIETK